MKPSPLIAALSLIASANLSAQSPDFSVGEVDLDLGGSFTAALPQTASTSYYRLLRLSDRTITEIELGPADGGEL